MGSSKKSKDKDREHKKKKKRRSSRSKSRERKERKDVPRSKSRSRSPRDRIKRDTSPTALLREIRRDMDSQKVKEELSVDESAQKSRSRRDDRSPEETRSHRLKRENRSPEESRSRLKREDKSYDESRSRRAPQSPEPPKPKVEKSASPAFEEGKGAGDSLSIEATNAIRAKLGLKPLDVGKKAPEDKETLKDDIHKPAVNIAEVKRTALIREKMAAAKEKRKVNQKLGKVRGLADSDSDDDASNWVKKQKKKEKEKQRADERAKLLDQMDEEFGISSLMEKDMKPSAPTYSSRDLRGLKVAHDQAMFKEGATTILTLADRGVLDEGGDELMNVNVLDLEMTEKNILNKKAKPTYNPYDVEEDEFGMLKPKDVLSKYDEEISGPKKGESFELSNKGSYNAAHEKRMLEIRSELQKGAHTLTMPEPSMASEFYTQTEMDAKFKKRKRKVRKVKRSETVKADDLLPLDDDENRLPGDESNVPVFSSEIASHLQSVIDQSPDLDDNDFSGKVNFNDDVEDDYHSSLALQRKLKQTKKMEPKLAAEKLLSAVGRDVGLDGDSDLLSAFQPEDSVMLTATDEFCRNLGSIPTYGQSGNRNETREELMDFEQELLEQSLSAAPTEEEKGGWERVEIQEEKPLDLDNLGVFQDSNVFEEEILLDGGIATALRHAASKGFVEAKAEKLGGVTVKDTSSLLAKNYSIEDKKHDDIDEKFKKRGRHERYQGPLQDFSERTYVPEFNLTYQDDQGRNLTQKEAFRVLSHKFHGKGSGKKKTEKRLKKLDEDHMMMTMNSNDTPLNTVARLKEKQIREQSAYIVLSGGNKTLTGNSVVK